MACQHSHRSAHRVAGLVSTADGWRWRTHRSVMTSSTLVQTISHTHTHTQTGLTSYYRMLIGSNRQAIEQYQFQWPWVISDTDYKVTVFFRSNISKRCKTEPQLLVNINRKSCSIYRMASFPMILTEWPLINQFNQINQKILGGLNSETTARTPTPVLCCHLTTLPSFLYSVHWLSTPPSSMKLLVRSHAEQPPFGTVFPQCLLKWNRKSYIANRFPWRPTYFYFRLRL